MLQVRFHGRGGQGVVTAAELLSLAAFDEGRCAQAFPSFGSERMGAPVVSFCRIDDHEIRIREPVLEPDVLIVIDPTLLHQVDVFGGLAPDGFILINTVKSFEQLGLGEFVNGFRRERLLTVPGGELARKHAGRPLANAALLGAFAALASDIDPLASDVDRRASDVDSRASDVDSRASDVDSRASDVDSRASDVGSRASDVGSTAADLDHGGSEPGSRARRGLISLEAVARAIRERFSGRVAEGNVAAASAAYDWVAHEHMELSGAAPAEVSGATSA